MHHYKGVICDLPVKASKLLRVSTCSQPAVCLWMYSTFLWNNGVPTLMEYHSTYWLIELLAWWEGRVQPSQLAGHWQCTRQHASKKLNEYNRQHPGLAYCRQSKSYRPQEHFIPRYIRSNVGEYLHWASTGAGVCGAPLPCSILPVPVRSIRPEFMRLLVQAIREQKRLDVQYLSLSNPDGEGRIIVPHHLVNTGQRWHVRAWCEKNGDYRDFVLSRFRDVPELLEYSYKGAGQDENWNLQLTLVLAPDSRLSAIERKIIEEDHGMQNGQLRLPVRACLLGYLLQRFGIHSHVLDINPKAQQLVIVNKDDVKEWIF